MAKLPNLIEHERSLWSIIVFVFKESIRGSRRYSILRYIVAGLQAGLAFVSFGALAIIVNEFAQHGIEGARLPVIIGGFLLLALSDFVPAILSSLNNYYWTTQVDDIGRHLQSLQFKKMHELDIGTIEQPEFQNMLENVNQRGWNSFYAVNNLIIGSIQNILSLAISTVSLIIISPLVLLVIFVASLPTYFLEKRGAELSAKLWKDNSEKMRIWRSKTIPIYTKYSLIEIKNFDLVLIFLKKFLANIGSFHAQAKDINMLRAKSDMLARLLLTIGFGAAFAIIIRDVYAGTLAIGALVFSFSVISRFQSSINQLFDNFGKLSEFKKNLDTYLDLLEMKPLVAPGTHSIDPATPIHIEFKNVSFAYPGSTNNVIDNLSLSIEPGSNIAIVGLNGAGKTTLIKLLTRVYDPTEGEILINGVALRYYEIRAWKRCIAVLMQEYALYSEESVAENIMLGDISKHDDVLVKKSASDTTIDEFVETLPKKYDQLVGTEFRGGVEFSKGQRQKLALARTLYRDAQIVILDEPTASVDALSEDAIFKNMQRHSSQTRIIISHKFSNVRDADKIILLENGSILEEGSHEELLAKSGKYMELFELQAKGYK